MKGDTLETARDEVDDIVFLEVVLTELLSRVNRGIMGGVWFGRFVKVLDACTT